MRNLGVAAEKMSFLESKQAEDEIAVAAPTPWKIEAISMIIIHRDWRVMRWVSHKMHNVCIVLR